MRRPFDLDQLDLQPALVEVALLLTHAPEVVRDVLARPEHLDRAILDAPELGLGQAAAIDKELDGDEVPATELSSRKKGQPSQRLSATQAGQERDQD